MAAIDECALNARQPRRLVCLLGLPIDVVDLSTAVAKVLRSVSTREKCVISTPNLNFLMAAQQDPAFRDSVLRSNLVLADGVSLLMLGRMMGVPLPERVSGADLFQALCDGQHATPVKVFFLGGPPGAAALASQKVNQFAKGVKCVGHDEGGFGDVESLSSQTLIDQINASGADFVVVSLGAKKGQAWIMRNHERLDAPLVCHLGAVVNFTAGTVRRAPTWMQRMGLEWLWRALTEPGLSKRYWDDGRALFLTVVRQLVHAAALERKVKSTAHEAATIASDRIDPQGVRHLALSGYWGAAESQRLKEALVKQAADSVVVDASRVTWMDPYAVGTLAGHHGELLARGGHGLVIEGLPSALERQFWRDGAAYMLRQGQLGER